MKTALFLCLLPGLALAADINGSWTNPTQNTDGTALTASDLDSTRMEFGTCSAPLVFGQKLGEVIVAAPLQKATASPAGYGTFCLRAYTRANYVENGVKVTRESSVSNTASVTVPAPNPAPPSGFTASLVTTSTVAYTVTNANDRLAFLIVGSVPLGTACDPSQHANGFNVVPRSAVTFDGPAKPTAVLARCQ